MPQAPREMLLPRPPKSAYPTKDPLTAEPSLALLLPLHPLPCQHSLVLLVPRRLAYPPAQKDKEKGITCHSQRDGVPSLRKLLPPYQATVPYETIFNSPSLIAPASLVNTIEAWRRGWP